MHRLPRRPPPLDRAEDERDEPLHPHFREDHCTARAGTKQQNEHEVVDGFVLARMLVVAATARN